MTIKEALEELGKVAAGMREDTRLLMDCPHCGRTGELGSLRPMIMAAPSTFRTEVAQEQASHDAEIRRIATALGLPGRASIEQIIEAIRAKS